jgi:hypothetical protein
MAWLGTCIHGRAAIMECYRRRDQEQIMTITEFLEARIAEDEALARAAGKRSLEWRSFGRSVYGGTIYEPSIEDGDEPDDGYGSIHIVYDEGSPHEDEAAHIARHDPARVLAECAAKRAIINEHQTVPTAPGRPDTTCAGCGLAFNARPCPTLAHLATVYTSHPDYQQEWAL